MSTLYELKFAASGQIVGPVTDGELRRMLANGLVRPDDLVRLRGQDTWTTIAETGLQAEGKPQVVRGPSLMLASVGGPGLRRRAGKLDVDTELELTPMIDVVFQLLIFFMLTGYFAMAPRADLPQAEAGQGVILEDKLVIDLAPDPEQPERILVWVGDQQPLTVDDFCARAEEIARASTATEALLRAGRDVPVGEVRRVMQALYDAGMQATVIGVQERRR